MDCSNHDYRLQIERCSAAILRPGIRVQSFCCSYCAATVERTIQSCRRCGCLVVTDGVALELPHGIGLNVAQIGDERRDCFRRDFSCRDFFCPDCAYAELTRRMPRPEPLRIGRQIVRTGNVLPPCLYRVRTRIAPTITSR